MPLVDDLKAQGKLDIDYERLWEILQHDACFEIYTEDGDACLRTWDDNPVMVAEVSGDTIDIPYWRDVGDLPRLVYDFVALGGSIDSITEAMGQYGDNELVPIYSLESQGKAEITDRPQDDQDTLEDSDIDYEAVFTWIGASRDNVIMSEDRSASLRQFGGSPAFVFVNENDGFETERIESANQMRDFAIRFYAKGGKPDDIRSSMT